MHSAPLSRVVGSCARPLPLIENESQRVHRTVSPSRGSAYPSNEPFSADRNAARLVQPARLQLALLDPQVAREVGLRYLEHPGLGFGDDFRELHADVQAAATGKRRKLDPEFLEQVARVYREALGTESPARAVHDRFSPTTPENARRWISLARKRGFLGEAPGRGQAGEQGGQDG